MNDVKKEVKGILKILKVVLNVIFYLVVLLLLIYFVIVIILRGVNDIFNVFGNGFFVVEIDLMVGDKLDLFNLNDLIFVRIFMDS